MDQEDRKILYDTILIILCGLLLCGIVGFLFLGNRIFKHTDPAIQFVIFGLSGSILYATIKNSTFRNYVLVLLLITVLKIVFSIT